MNIRGGNKSRIDSKKQELKLELSKSKEEQNKDKIKRLRESIGRNKKISYINTKMRKLRKWKGKNK